MGIRVSADWLNCLNTIDTKDSKIDFEMRVIVVEAIRGRCASFMILIATVSEMMWWTDKCIYFSSIGGNVRLVASTWRHHCS